MSHPIQCLESDTELKKKNRVLEYGQGNILRVVTDLGKTSLFEYVLQRFLQGLQG